MAGLPGAQGSHLKKGKNVCILSYLKSYCKTPSGSVLNDVNASAHVSKMTPDQGYSGIRGPSSSFPSSRQGPCKGNSHRFGRVCWLP